MTTPMPPSGFWQALIETVFKPFTIILNPIAERIGRRLKRKPKLHIHVISRTEHWCYAWENDKPRMSVMFSADITNDDHQEKVFIIDAYIKGTKPTIPFLRKVEIPAATLVPRVPINMYVYPIVGKGGQNWTGRIILLDQFKREHKTDKIEFVWHGTTECPVKPQTPPQADAAAQK
jgi:hypothetical protein